VAELRVTVGMVLPLLRLPIALQAVVQLVENLRDFRMADRMPAPSQGLGKVSTSRGSDTVIGLRPAPGRRIRPSHATPASISWIPLAIAFRDSPQA
jgi:hypothetical protein